MIVLIVFQRRVLKKLSYICNICIEGLQGTPIIAGQASALPLSEKILPQVNMMINDSF